MKSVKKLLIASFFIVFYVHVSGQQIFLDEILNDWMIDQDLSYKNKELIYINCYYPLIQIKNEINERFDIKSFIDQEILFEYLSEKKKKDTIYRVSISLLTIKPEYLEMRISTSYNTVKSYKKYNVLVIDVDMKINLIYDEKFDKWKYNGLIESMLPYN